MKRYLGFILTIVVGCSGLEDASFLSKYEEKQMLDQTTDRALSAWVDSYNEAVSKDRSFWASTWQQLESSLIQMQRNFGTKVGSIQLRSKNDAIIPLPEDPDIAAALRRMK